MREPRGQPLRSALRLASQLASLILTATLLAGCGELRERAIALWPFGTPPTPTPTIVPIALLGWTGSEAENAHLQQAIATFEQANPTWPVAGRLLPDYNTALETELDGPTPPDLFLAQGHQLSSLVEEGRLLPIPPAFQVDTGIAPNLLAGTQVNGQSYCFPRDVALLALFYNPAVFDRADTPYPQSGWGWTEFRAAIDATADINNGFYGLTLDYDLSRFMPFLLQSSQDDDLWQGDDALQALEYFMDLYNDEVAAVPARLDSTWNGEAFGRGRAAMTIEGNWLVGYLASSFPSLDYGIVELPHGPSGPATTAFLTCWVVNADAANPAGALALGSFLSSAPQVSTWADVSGNLPLNPELANLWAVRNPKVALFASAISYATPWHGPAGFVARAETVNLSMNSWYNDNMTTPQLVGVLATMSENPPLPTPTATPSGTPAD